MPYDLHHPACIIKIFLFSCQTEKRPWELAGVSNSWRQATRPLQFGGAGAAVWKNLRCRKHKKKNQQDQKCVSYFSQDRMANLPTEIFAGVEAIGPFYYDSDFLDMSNFVCLKRTDCAFGYEPPIWPKNRQIISFTKSKSLPPVNGDLVLNSGEKEEQQEEDSPPLPQLESIGLGFCSRTIVHEIHFPKVPFPRLKIIYNEFLRSAKCLEELDLSCAFGNVEVIEHSFLLDCTSIKRVLFPQRRTKKQHQQQHEEPFLWSLKKLGHSFLRNTASMTTPNSSSIEKLEFGIFLNKLASIEGHFCSGLTKLKQVIFPEPLLELVEVKTHFLSDAKELEEIDLTNVVCGPRLKSISNAFLSGCLKLKRITFPASLASSPPATTQHFEIGQNFLYSCTALKKIDFGIFLLKVSSIGHGFSSNCSSLEEIVWISTTTTTSSAPQDNDDDAEYLTTHHLPHLRSIGDGFLSQCGNLESIDLSPIFSSPKLESVGANFLAFATKLKNIVFMASRTTPKSSYCSLKQFDSSFLFKCTNLLTLDLSSFKHIEVFGKRFCQGCSSLTKVVMPNDLRGVRIIEEHMFADCKNLMDIDLRSMDCSKMERLHDTFFRSPMFMINRRKEGNNILLSDELKVRFERSQGKF